MTTHVPTRRAAHRLLATLAAALRDTPATPEALVAACAAHLTGAPWELPCTLALRRDGAWTLFGYQPPAAQRWLDGLRDGAAQTVLPIRSTRLAIAPGLELALALWSAALSRDAFANLSAWLGTLLAHAVDGAHRNAAAAAPNGHPPFGDGDVPRLLRDALEIGRLLSTARPLDELLHDVAAALQPLLQARWVGIALAGERPTEGYRAVACVGAPREQFQALLEAVPPGPTTTTLDGAAEARYITPLRDPSGTTLGMMAAGVAPRDQEAHAMLIDALEIFAAQLAIAVQNARLHAEARRRLAEQQALTRIQRAAAATLDLRCILREVYAGLREVLAFESFHAVVYQPGQPHNVLALTCQDQRWQELETTRDKLPVAFRRLLEQAPPTWATSQRAPVPADADGEAATCISAPIVAPDEERIGALALRTATPHRFGDEAVRVLQTVAQQVAISLQHARLLHDRERQIAQMRMLNHISRVAASTLDPGQLFLALYEAIRHYRSTDTLVLVICDPDQGHIQQLLSMDHGTLHRIDEPHAVPPNSYTDLILRRGEPLLINDAQRATAELGAQPVTIGRRRASSLVAVPLRDTSGRAFGMLSMQSYQPGEYNQSDIEFLANVANQVALNIQNAALFKRSEAQVRQLAAETERLELLSRVAGWANATLDARELLQRTVSEIGQLTAARQARLLMLDRQRGLAICQAEYRDSGGVGTLALPIAATPLFEWCDRHHRSLLIPNALDDQRFAAAHAHWRTDDIRDVLIVPLIVKNEVIGVISVGIEAREQSFSPRDVAVCETIARQVATAIENARLWETTQQSVRELTLLYDLSVSLASMLDLDEILVTLAGAALEIERADYSAILLQDQHGRLSRGMASTHDGDFVAPRPWADQATLEAALRQTQPVILEQPGLPPLRPDDPAPASALLVPIIVKGEPVGITVVASATPRLWSERDRSLLTILASQMASSIENVRLFESEQEKRRLADTLREVALALTSTLELPEVLATILVQLQRVVPYDRASVQLLRDDHQLVIIAGREQGAAQTFDQVSFPADDPRYPNQRVIAARQPVIVHDVQRAYPIFATLDRAMRVRSWLGVPLIYNNELLGMIALDSFQDDFYTDAMADVALMFATQAAQAIAHARLFEQIRSFNAELERMVAARTAELTAEKERLEAVHAITTTLTASLDVDEIAVKTLELAASAINVRRGSLLLRDPMQERLMYRAVLHEHGTIVALNKPFGLPPGNMVDWVVRHQQGVVISDVRNDPRWIELGRSTADVRSFIAVPLVAADLTIGVLMFNDRQPGYFNEEHLRLLATIASEVAIAVHNAELYSYINEQATRLAELLQIQREETVKNRAILESISEGVVVLDDQETVVLYNRAASQVLHIAGELVLGQHLQRITRHGTPAERERARRLYATLSEGVRAAREQNGPRDALIELPDQTIAMTFTPVITPDEERIGVAVVLRDITREIEADRAKREFISTVSHELRTPLTSVKGYVELLMLGTGGPLTEMQRQFLSVIKANADRLNSLVEDLLEISRLENGKVMLQLKPVDLREVIDDIVTSLRTETERKRMRLSIEVDPDLPVIEADPKRVGQILTNLLSNAHKYTREGGQITVRARRSGEMVQVDVADTGVGIPADELPKMFSRFFRSNNALKDEVGGTGLGLSIARSFVELHGGTIWVVSEEEVGSTFSFTLPIRQPADAEAPA